ncbi:hypothetical protein BWI17_17955 [Betaproteobacteria bacterium GR16-43]|nr:hypothetical protein BWI17_17955 [Betaproteobacteria bacterium GR16-43]
MDLSETEDLEALFDQVSAQSAVAASQVPIAAAVVPVQAGTQPESESDDMFHRVGSITRQLHDALRELGIDKQVECAVTTLRGDAQSRLQYIAKLTGEAAEKVLTAVEKGQTEMTTLDGSAKALHAQWERVFAKASTPEEFRQTAMATRDFLAEASQSAGRTNQELLTIMMAQDFHDLTGQVIQRIVKLAETLETNLVQLLIEATPADKRATITQHEGFLNGPAMNTTERTDVVANQAQVDDLLASLGF